MVELLYKEESYAIVGAAMEVYNQLGHGFLEAVYQEALELEARHIPFQEQQELQFFTNGGLFKKGIVPILSFTIRSSLKSRQSKNLAPMRRPNYLIISRLQACGWACY